MTPQELKTVEINTRVFHRKEELILTVVNVVGFTKEGRIYIPCADDKNNIDDYRIDDLILFSGEKTETENIYLNRLKEQYKQSELLVVQGNFYLSGYDKAKTYYDAMRLFCLDTQLLDFNTIEVMENEVNSSF